MKEHYEIVRCCVDVHEAVSREQPVQFCQRLRELANVLGPHDIDDPAFDGIGEAVNDLATRANESEQLAPEQDLDSDRGVPRGLQQQAVALSQRVCEYCLRNAEPNPISLLDSNTEQTANAGEEVATDKDRLEVENVMWAARARALVAERYSALDTIEQILEQLEALDTERSRLERSRRALEEAASLEREANERTEQINDLARDL